MVKRKKPAERPILLSGSGAVENAQYDAWRRQHGSLRPQLREEWVNERRAKPRRLRGVCPHCGMEGK
jgi:hypothetical protein